MSCTVQVKIVVKSYTALMLNHWAITHPAVKVAVYTTSTMNHWPDPAVLVTTSAVMTHS